MPQAYNVQEGFQYVPLVTTALPIFTFYKPQALSAAESAGPGTMGFNPSGSGAYYSGSNFVQTGSIYYAADLQRYRILKNKATGWEDLVPTGSSAVAFPYTGSAQITGSLGVTGSISQGDSNIAFGQFSHAEGSITTAKGENSHTEGRITVAI
jgi:hypothetical protein